MNNKIRVDRGDLFELLLAAEALLAGRGQAYLETTPESRLEETRTTAGRLRDELLA